MGRQFLTETIVDKPFHFDAVEGFQRGLGRVGAIVVHFLEGLSVGRRVFQGNLGCFDCVVVVAGIVASSTAVVGGGAFGIAAAVVVTTGSFVY